jgi:hypothetical protein
LSHTPQEAFADRIGSRSMIRCFEKLNSTRSRHTSETGPKCALVLTDQILRYLPIGRGFSQLLRHPGIGWSSYHSNLDHPSCFERDDEKCEERSKEEISHLQEIAGPESCRVMVQKGRPPLSSRPWCWCANISDVLLDGSLTRMKTQFEEFPPNPLSTPMSMLHCSLPDQGDGFWGYLRLMRSGL